MPIIRVETLIDASREKCFDLARDTAIHEKTTSSSKEQVVSLKRNGQEILGQSTQLELGDEVTFQATHFGIKQRLTSKIVTYDRPVEFTDAMQRGAFRSLHHIHQFEQVENGTRMVDILEFQSPAWFIGWLVDNLVLARYMRRFIEERGRALKAIAEDSTA
jgi:ligand-binding SRPBCC domain-containing protein